MQLLRENKILMNYVFPIISIPIIIILINFIFHLGKYYGTFIRALYELVLKNI